MGLFLVWLRTTSKIYILKIIFGVSESLISNYLWFMKMCVIECLKHYPLEKLCQPSTEKINEYKKMISDRHPLLKNGTL